MKILKLLLWLAATLPLASCVTHGSDEDFGGLHQVPENIPAAVRNAVKIYSDDIPGWAIQIVIDDAYNAECDSVSPFLIYSATYDETPVYLTTGQSGSSIFHLYYEDKAGDIDPVDDEDKIEVFFASQDWTLMLSTWPEYGPEPPDKPAIITSRVDPA
jgi:hypothetical protein